MRLPTLALLLLPAVAAAPAHAATIFLKVKAEPGTQPVRLTVKALSHAPVNLSPEPLVYVDEGQGFKARPDLRCRIANSENALRLEADREFTGTCELRSEEHTSELQSLRHLVCRLLLEKKKKTLYSQQ